MAATRVNSVQSDDVLASIGGAITADDDLIFAYPWYQALINSPDQDGTTINSLSILPECHNNFGSPNVALRFKIATAAASLLLINGAGSYFSFRSDANTGGIRNVTFDPVNPGARLLLDTCDTEAFLMRRGAHAEIGADCDLANAYLHVGESLFAYTATLPLTLVEVNSRHRTKVGRDVTTVTIRDDGVFEAIHEQCTPGTVNIGGRGTYKGRTGNIGTVNLTGEYPTLDLTGFAVAPAITTLNIYAPHRILIPKNGPTVTIPSATVEHFPRNIVRV